MEEEENRMWTKVFQVVEWSASHIAQFNGSRGLVSRAKQAVDTYVGQRLQIEKLEQEVVYLKGQLEVERSRQGVAVHEGKKIKRKSSQGQEGSFSERKASKVVVSGDPDEGISEEATSSEDEIGRRGSSVEARSEFKSEDDVHDESLSLVSDADDDDDGDLDCQSVPRSSDKASRESGNNIPKDAAVVEEILKRRGASFKAKLRERKRSGTAINVGAIANRKSGQIDSPTVTPDSESVGQDEEDNEEQERQLALVQNIVGVVTRSAGRATPSLDQGHPTGSLVAPAPPSNATGEPVTRTDMPLAKKRWGRRTFFEMRKGRGNTVHSCKRPGCGKEFCNQSDLSKHVSSKSCVPLKQCKYCSHRPFGWYVWYRAHRQRCPGKPRGNESSEED